MKNVLFARGKDVDFYFKAASERDSHHPCLLDVDVFPANKKVNLNMNQTVYALGASLLMKFSSLFIREKKIAMMCSIAAKEAWKEFRQGNRFIKIQSVDQSKYLQAMVVRGVKKASLMHKL